MECDAEKLISLVKSRPIIYNYKLKEYSNRNIVDQSWLEISEEMQCDMAFCKDKWTTLRNSYSRALRKQNCLKTGSMGIPTKRWYLQDDMSFIREFMRQERDKRISSTSSENSCNFLNKLDDYDETSDYSYQQSSPQIQTPSDPQMPECKRRKSITPAEVIPAPMGQQFHESYTTENENPNILFFRSLLPDLYKLSSKRQRAFKSFTFQKLMELLDEEEYESGGAS